MYTSGFLSKQSLNLCLNFVRTAKSIAAKAVPSAGMVRKEKLPVETDPVKLTTHLCGGNIYKTGEDPELKADEEYPEWLWSMRIERGPTPLEELDPQSDHYWNIVKRQNIRRWELIAKQKNKFKEY